MLVRDHLGALQEREFRLLFTGQIVSLLGDRMVIIALAFAVLDLTGSVADLGYVTAAYIAPLVAFLLVGGVFADRLPRRAVMLSADLVRLGSQGTAAGLLLSHQAHIWELIVLQAVAGSATAFFNPASTGLTPLTVTPERLQQANALRGMSMASAGIVGPAIGGALVAGVGPGWAIAVDAASFGASAIFLALLRLPVHVKLPPQSFLRDLREGWVEFTSRTWVWVIVLAASLGNMMTAWFFVLGAAISKAHLGGVGAWALILSAFAAGNLVGSVVALRVHVRRPLFFASSLLLPLAIPISLLALRAPAWAIAVGAVAAGAGNMIFNSLWETALQQHVPAAALSRVAAYDWFGSLAFQPLGLAIVGPVAAGIGQRATLWIAAAGVTAMTLLAVGTPSVRELEAVVYDS
jgi:predicted MFS family arabinose efflux permease